MNGGGGKHKEYKTTQGKEQDLKDKLFQSIHRKPNTKPTRNQNKNIYTNY